MPFQRGSVPNTPEEFAAAYLASEIAKAADRELDEHLADSARLEAQTQEFKEAVAEEKAKGAGKNNPYVCFPFPASYFRLHADVHSLYTVRLPLDSGQGLHGPTVPAHLERQGLDHDQARIVHHPVHHPRIALLQPAAEHQRPVHPRRSHFLHSLVQRFAWNDRGYVVL